MNDPFASIAEPSNHPNPSDPFASIAEHPASIAEHPAVAAQGYSDNQTKFQRYIDKLKHNFNVNTSGAKPGETGVKAQLKNFGAGGGDVIRALAHPLRTAEGMIAPAPSTDPGILGKVENLSDVIPSPIPGVPSFHSLVSMSRQPARSLGQIGTGMLLGEAGGRILGSAPFRAAGSALRDAAIGDPNSAALRGLQVGPKSPKALGTIKSVEGARPYFHGVKTQAELQARVPQVKAEVWEPYKQAVDAVGDKPVKGPDGITTVRQLEAERSQLSALNRGLKKQLPEAIQLAQQKGMTQAQLLARERIVQNALDPELEKTGIKPTLIRKTFGQISQVGERVSGKSTAIEKAEPTGLGKIANLSLEHPLQAPQMVARGVRDLVAGRPLLEAKPTDLGIREGFRKAGPKPDLGRFAVTGNPPPPRGLLQAPQYSIPLHGAGETPGTLSRPITLNQFDKPTPLGLPAPRFSVPLSSYHDIFPNQMPGSDTGIPSHVPTGSPRGLGYSEYIGEVPGERGGVASPKGTLNTRDAEVVRAAKKSMTPKEFQKWVAEHQNGGQQ